LLLQPDSKILVGGGTSSFETPFEDFVLARFDSNGSLDATFGTGGRVITSFGEGTDIGYAIAMQQDGKILMAGTAGPTSLKLDFDFAVVRYESGLRIPRISSIAVSGKKLFIFGNNFDIGAKLYINGEKQKTANDEDSPSIRLIAKKAGIIIKAGDKLQVRNSDGIFSREITYSP
jgi:uncharacterized delta-60 repeat protein